MHRSIRTARLEDVETMREMERAAGRLFSEIGMDDIANHAPPESVILGTYIQHQRAWIAAVDDQPVGYALVDVVDGCGHLEQVSVHPAFGRQGLGRMLIQSVVDWAEARGLRAITLLTFRDVPWNGPYYASLGFAPLADAELTPGLLALRAHESDLGLDRESRHAMRLDLPAQDGVISGQSSRRRQGA